jgi:hypothetical protein
MLTEFSPLVTGPLHFRGLKSKLSESLISRLETWRRVTLSSSICSDLSLAFPTRILRMANRPMARAPIANAPMATAPTATAIVATPRLSMCLDSAECFLAHSSLERMHTESALIPDFEAGPSFGQEGFRIAADKDCVMLLLHGIRIVESRTNLNVLASALGVSKIVVKQN